MSLSDISSAFAELSQCKGQVSYVFLTRAPLTPKGPFDLHVLGTPPAFILSQDQTLHEFVCRFRYSLEQLLADRARLSHSSAVKVHKRAVCGRALFHKVTKSRCGVSTPNPSSFV